MFKLVKYLFGTLFLGAVVFLHSKTEQNNLSLANLHLDIKRLADNLKYLELENGLKVVLYKDNSKPKVLTKLAYNVGSSIERSYEKGLAHLVEHMIFKGTDILAEGDIDAIARKYGANFNAFTSHDVTAYYFETTKGNWKHFVEILADCMNNSRFDEEHLSSELKAVVQELNMYRDNLESKVFEKALELSFAPNHPYHFPIIGFKEQLANLHAPQLKDFYKRYYHPSKAAIFIIGDIDFSDAEIEVRKNFGHFTNPDTVYYPEFPGQSPELFSSDLTMYEEVEQEKLCYYWKVPGLAQINTALADVFFNVFASGANSRLYKALVDDKEIASDVELSADLMYQDGVMALFVTPNDKDFSVVRQVVAEEIAKILKDGFTAEEVDRAKLGIALNFVRKTEKWGDLVWDLMAETFITNDPKRVFGYLGELDAVTNVMVQDFFVQHVFADRVATISLRSLPGSMKSAWQKNLEYNKAAEAKILSNHLRTTPLEDAKRVHQLPKPEFFKTEFPQPEVYNSEKTGIKLLLYKKNPYPIAFFKLNFKNSYLLSKEQEGLLVDVMMQMLVEKSKKYSREESLEFLEGLGAQFNLDSDGVAVNCLAGNFASALHRVFEIFCEPVFESEALEKHRQILLSDLLEQADNPQRVGIRSFYKSCYPNSGFAWSHEEAVDFVQKITLADIVACHKKYCNPGAFFTAAAGQVDKAFLIDLLDQSFANIEPHELNFSRAEGVISVETEHVTMLRDQVVLLLARPSSLTISSPDYLPLSVLNLIMFYSLGSRLYQIREQKGLFYNIFGGFGLDASGLGSVDYICTMLNLEDVELAKSEILRIIEDAKQNGITQSELDDAKQVYLGSLVGMFSDTPAVMQVLVSLNLFDLSFDYYSNILDRLDRLTIEDVNDAAKRYIKMDQFMTVTVGKQK